LLAWGQRKIMSTPNTKKKRIHFSFFLVLAMLIYAIVMLLNQSRVIEGQKDRESELLRQKENLEAEIHSLENELDYIGSDEYIEQMARERLGWVKEDEIKFIEEESDQ
jgi:cell division protein DivIC